LCPDNTRDAASGDDALHGNLAEPLFASAQVTIRATAGIDRQRRRDNRFPHHAGVDEAPVQGCEELHR
jgi:hypothetical protein